MDEGDWSRVERIRHGDDLAFDELMDRYKRPILNYIYRVLGDAAEAEDVAQESFARAYRAIAAGRLRPSGRFSTWLFQVARNAALDRVRQRRRHPAQSLDVLETVAGDLPDRTRTAAEEAVAGETGRAIAAAVALLPEDQRTALILSEYEGCPDSEIAAVLRCSVKAVESRLYRAKRFLRDHLAGFLN